MPSSNQMSEGGFTLEEAKKLAAHMGIDFSKVDYTLQEFHEGIKEELEHKDVTDGMDTPTAKIAIAHLKEDPEYYDKLEVAMEKSVGLPEELDSTHEYVYREGEFGSYSFWYKDPLSGNYFKYSNAPEDSKDHDPLLGEPLLVTSQPLPHTHPQFYTPEGKKRCTAAPTDAELEQNPNYDPKSSSNVWFERYTNGEEVRFLYLDADVRENLDLWVQYKLRVTDVCITNLRRKATQMFQKEHPKDRILGAILMLSDQGMYSPAELVNAKVSDLDFIDQTAVLLGRKIIPDLTMFDFLTSLKFGRDPADPLFQLNTAMGKQPLGIRHVYSIFKGLMISPAFLVYWHVNHIFSRVMNRLFLSKMEPEDALQRALQECATIAYHTGDIEDYVDYKLKRKLLDGFDTLAGDENDPGGLEKSLPTLSSTAIVQVFSDLSTKRDDEQEFSAWLHAEPWHDYKEDEVEDVESV